jgi:hypothetical protein
MISDFLADGLLDAIFRGSTASPPCSLSISAIHVSLHTATPGRMGANEVAGGSYARQHATFDAAASRVTQNDVAALFSALPACTVTHVGFWDDSSPPNFLLGHQLAIPRTFLAGDNGNFPIGTITPGGDWT